MKKSVKFFILLTIAVITNALALFFILPKTQLALKESSAKDKFIKILEEPVVYRNKINISLYFTRLSAALENEYETRSFDVLIDDINLQYNLIQELLKGPTLSALQQGYVSLINPKTRLLGLNIVPSYAFINLSREFSLDFSELNIQQKAAMEQIFRTINSFKKIKKLIVLVEGKPYSEFSL